MARKLVGRPSVAAVEQLVRRVLDDPQARLVFWLPRSGQFVDRHGTGSFSTRRPRPSPGVRSGTGTPAVLAVVHDVVLSEDSELVEAVGAASLLTLENRRLRARSARLGGRAARLPAAARGAASAERRKIERDLHDGVQQKLVALRIQLELARDLADENGLGAGSTGSRPTSTMRSTSSARRRTASIRRSSPTRGSMPPSARSRGARACRSPSISTMSAGSPRIARPRSTTAASRRSRTSRSMPATTPSPRCGSGGTARRCASGPRRRRRLRCRPGAKGQVQA